MIVIVVALLLTAALSVGLRATAGWLDTSHPMDRLAVSLAIGAVMVWLALVLSARAGFIQGGFGLVFSLAPVGLYDVTKWWFRARRGRTPWLVGASASVGVVALRWVVVAATVFGLTWLTFSGTAAALPPL